MQAVLYLPRKSLEGYIDPVGLDTSCSRAGTSAQQYGQHQKQTCKERPLRIVRHSEPGCSHIGHHLEQGIRCSLSPVGITALDQKVKHDQQRKDYNGGEEEFHDRIPEERFQGPCDDCSENQPEMKR